MSCPPKLVPIAPLVISLLVVKVVPAAEENLVVRDGSGGVREAPSRWVARGALMPLTIRMELHDVRAICT